MIKEARGFGSNIDEAKENAIAELNVAEDADIQFEVIDFPKKKTLGLFGGKKAQVRVYVEMPDRKPRPQKKNQPKSQNKDNKPAKAVEKPQHRNTPVAERSQEKPVAEKRKFDEAWGEPVAASEIPADSKAGRAIAYLKSILEALGCTDITMKAAVKDNAALIELDGEGLGVVIGHRGETLDSLQYLTGLAASNGGGYFKVSLNIGNYREKREEALTSLATRVSQQVLKTGKNRTLEPMNPYERRIIHTAVQGIEGVVSVSFGEGSSRRVVIAVEGSDPRPQRRDGNRRGGSRRPSSKPAQSTVVSREPKKDSDMPLYGKIN